MRILLILRIYHKTVRITTLVVEVSKKCNDIWSATSKHVSISIKMIRNILWKIIKLIHEFIVSYIYNISETNIINLKAINFNDSNFLDLFCRQEHKAYGIHFCLDNKHNYYYDFCLILHSAKEWNLNEILVDDSSLLLPRQDFTSRYILFVKMMDFLEMFFSRLLRLFSKQMSFYLLTDAHFGVR